MNSNKRRFEFLVYFGSKTTTIKVEAYTVEVANEMAQDILLEENLLGMVTSINLVNETEVEE